METGDIFDIWATKMPILYHDLSHKHHRLRSGNKPNLWKSVRKRCLTASSRNIFSTRRFAGLLLITFLLMITKTWFLKTLQKLLTFYAESDIIKYINIFGGLLWNISKLLKLAISATVQRTAAAANARHHASLLARQAAVSLTSSVRTRKTSNHKNAKCRPWAAFLV